MTKPVTWRTRDGTVLPVRAMTDDHLLAAVSYCRRGHRARCFAWARHAGQYALFAPDGAADAAEQAEREFLDASDADTDAAIAAVLPIYGSLLREAHRRRLGVQLTSLRTEEDREYAGE